MHKFIFIFTIVGLLIGCQQEKKQAVNLQGNASGSCSSGASSSSEVGALFTIDGMTIERKSLPDDIKQFIYKNEHEAYTKNQTIFKELALRIHLAKKQGKYKDLKTLPGMQELMQVSKVTEADAKKFFEENKNRMPPNIEFGAMKERIMQYLEGQQAAKQFYDQMEELEKKGAYVSAVVPPMPPEIALDVSQFPTIGDKAATVKIIEISDYLCGHCQRAHPEVKSILKDYKGKISFSQANFSLNEKGMSGTYVRGAYCALQKGEEQFWKYHHAAFEKASEPHDHSKGHSHSDGDSKEAVTTVNSVAKKIGLDLDTFKKCLQGDAAKAYVSKMNSIISSKGINSTPTFIVNNKKIEGGIAGLRKALDKLLK